MMRDRVAVGEGSLFKSARKHAYESELKKSAMFPVLFHHHTSSVRISRTHLPSRMHRPEENRVINSEVKRIGYQVGFLSVGNCLQRNPVSSHRERYVWYRTF